MRYVVICETAEPLSAQFLAYQSTLQQVAPVKASTLPFHITLVPPFQEEAMAKRVQRFLAAQKMPAFAYRVDGFAHFERRVLYVPVTPSQSMLDFVSALHAAIAFTPKPNPPVFHISLVSKKVEPYFDDVWEALQRCSALHEQAYCHSVSLYGWQEGGWILLERYVFSDERE